ncbi:MAG: hypothetical protein ACYTGH_07505, partial [Planctomycetota bacterium]
MSEEKKTFIAGITPRSIAASIACMLTAGIYLNYLVVYLGIGWIQPEQILSPTTMSLLMIMILLSGVVFALTKTRLLNRAEMLCVLFSLLLSAPMMSQGTWHRLVGLISAPARTQSFHYIDAYSDNWWPHGKNLLEGGLTKEKVKGTGPAAAWNEVEYETDTRGVLPQLTNEKAGDQSASTLTLPLQVEGRDPLHPNYPHLFSVLAKLENKGPESVLYARIYEDDSPRYREVLNTREADKVTYIHQKGFVRLGTYGLTFSPNCKQSVKVEFGLRGRGTATFGDPKLFSVFALETAYKGRKGILESEWEALPPEKRIPGLVIKPDNMWSV